MSPLPEQPFSMVNCPFQTRRRPLNPQLLPTPLRTTLFWMHIIATTIAMIECALDASTFFGPVQSTI